MARYRRSAGGWSMDLVQSRGKSLDGVAREAEWPAPRSSASARSVGSPVLTQPGPRWLRLLSCLYCRWSPRVRFKYHPSLPINLIRELHRCAVIRRALNRFPLPFQGLMEQALEIGLVRQAALLGNLLRRFDIGDRQAD